MPLSLHDRRPDLVTSLNEAYAEAQTQQDQAATIGGAALSDVIASETAAATASGELRTGLYPLDQIANPDTRLHFSEQLDEISNLFDRIGYAAPTAEQLEASGVDFERLGALYETMTAQAERPEIILAPNLADDEWGKLYDEIANETWPAIRAPLRIARNIRNNWSGINEIPADVPNVVPGGEKSTSWTIRLIPGNPSPNTVNVTAGDEVYKSNHPFISEYLTLQALRLLQDKEPIDKTTHTNTWLSGEFESSNVGSAVIFGTYEDDEVVIAGVKASTAIDKYGARPARW